MMDTDWLRAEIQAKVQAQVQTPVQDPERGPTRQRALTEALRRAILQGRLATGTRLPASRTLAVDLGLARNTVLYAYEQLSAEGYLQPSRHGTRVAPLALAPAAQTGAGVVWPALSQRAQAALRPEAGGEQGLLPFALGVPDVASFPIRAWRASLDSAWRQASARHLGYAPQGGEPALREALAAYLSGVRGVAVEAAQVVITAGTQSSLDLCARLLADAGDTAWVEDPGYPAARTAFQLAGLRLHGVAVDDAGLAPTPADWQAHPPRLVFVTPSHQFPTGAVLTLARRLALIEQAQAAGAWIIEDDYESEFRPGGPPLPALYGLRPAAPVVYAGTFSKTLFPALRLGYLLVPAPLAARVAQFAAQATRPGQSVEQLALADFIDRGRYTSHLRRMRRLYAERRTALRAALAEHFGPDVRITGGEAGLHVLLRWSGAPQAQAVCTAALALGVTARPLSRYALAPGAEQGLDQGLVLGYGATPLPLIDSAVRRLRQAWNPVGPQGVRPL